MTKILTSFEGQNYLRKTHTHFKGPKWYNIDGPSDEYIHDCVLEEKLEEEYQKTLIPTKTLNPSEEKGFDLTNYMDNFFNESFGIPKPDELFVMKAFRNWFKNQANGEKPEVVNPVGQVDEDDKIELFYNIINKGIITEKDKVLHISAQTLADIIYSHKPRETDKEKPKKYKCMKRNCTNMISKGDFCSDECYKEGEYMREFDD